MEKIKCKRMNREIELLREAQFKIISIKDDLIEILIIGPVNLYLKI